jgi:acyl dehydratase
MAVDPKFVGRTYGPYQYTLGLEKMREFAFVVAGAVPTIGFGDAPKDLNPLLYDERVARDGPYGAVVAMPNFAVTFAIKPFADAVADPELQINLLMLVHGEQDLEFNDVMRAGDVMTTTGTILKITTKSEMDFVVVQTESKNQHGKLVVKGTWTAVIRQK